MVQTIKTFTNLGLIGHEISIEADSAQALPIIDIIGLPDTAIKEAKERIKGTFRNCEISLPKRKFVLNLAPSDIRKVGTSFDLPMALSILLHGVARRIYHTEILDKSLFFGELGLNGSVKRINGLLPSVLSAKKKGRKVFFIPKDNFFELEYIPDITVYPIEHFRQLIEYFLQGTELEFSAQHKDF
jgi:magnesium chelatase family protein